MKRSIVKFLWESHRRSLLDFKGLKNNTICFDDKFLDLFIDVYYQRRALLSLREMYNIYALVQKVKSIEGDIVEVGVYKGGSARIICEVKERKSLHLFDTFEGMPEVAEVDTPVFRTGQCVPVYDEVVKLLAPYPRIHLHKGFFPDTTAPAEHLKFSLVHLDPDIYDSMKAGLGFFYPRMSSGGVILLHDYPNGPGVVKAINEFMADKPQTFFEAGWRQCFIVKP